MGRLLPLFPEAAASPTLREVADAVRLAGVEGLPDARERADRARYQEVHVRSALTAPKGMGFKWALNPYRGCTHACEYCYARKYQKHLELDAGDAFSSVIFVKRNLPDVLRRELTRGAWRRELVAIGTATDPYQPIEGHYRITRRCLEVLVEAETPFSIVTKGPMVVRDLDVLARSGTCRVYLSVPSVDEAAWTQLEPGTASPAQRLRAAKALADAGVDAAVLMMPLVPGITTSRRSIERTVEAIASAGVPLAGAGVAHLEAGVREYFFGFLSRAYPELLEGYERLYTGSYASGAYVDAVKEVVAGAKARATAEAATPVRSGPAGSSAP
ncbi:MAG: radical SAM protein [Vicinamibacterales bacterium]